MTHSEKKIILVSGAPGSGKTTFSRALADRLGYALIAKDDLKESIFDSLDGPVGDRAFSRKIGGAAMELLWMLAERCPRVILEANFRPHSELERTRLEALTGSILEIHCTCPKEECVRRYNERADSVERHRTHFGKLTVDTLSEFDIPVSIGQVIEVDTAKPVVIDDLTAEILRIWNKS
jgi:predicted kinase